MEWLANLRSQIPNRGGRRLYTADSAKKSETTVRNRMALDRNLDEKGDVTNRIRDMKKMQKKKK